MGVDTNLHIGAYLEIHTNPIQIEKKFKCCVNHTEKNFEEYEQFCHICGNKLTIKTVVKERWPELEDLCSDDMNLYDIFNVTDPMSKLGERMLLHSNQHQEKDHPYEIDFDYGDAEITEDMIETYKTNFYTYHKEEIEYLRSKVKSLEIKFGVLYYYS